MFVVFGNFDDLEFVFSIDSICIIFDDFWFKDRWDIVLFVDFESGYLVGMFNDFEEVM